MICKPNNEVLFECIQEIIQNVNNREYCYNSLYPTGPGLLGEKYFNGDMSKIKEIELFNSFKGDCIITREKEILKMYREYRVEQKNMSKVEHYHKLWAKRKIYK